MQAARKGGLSMSQSLDELWAAWEAKAEELYDFIFDHGAAPYPPELQSRREKLEAEKAAAWEAWATGNNRLLTEVATRIDAQNKGLTQLLEKLAFRRRGN
jgi:hypothetical protein